MKRIRTGWLTLAAASLIAACSGMQTRERASTLDTATSTFETLVRWGEYEDAAKYVVPRTGDPKPVDFKLLKHIRVVSYDITDQALSPDQNEAKVSAVVGFYDDETAVLHTMHYQQTWWYDAPGKHWFLETGFPDFLAEINKKR